MKSRIFWYLLSVVAASVDVITIHDGSITGMSLFLILFTALLVYLVSIFVVLR